MPTAGVNEPMKPLKRVLCWIIGHNWLASRYDTQQFEGEDGRVGGAGRLR